MMEYQKLPQLCVHLINSFVLDVEKEKVFVQYEYQCATAEKIIKESLAELKQGYYDGYVEHSDLAKMRELTAYLDGSGYDSLWDMTINEAPFEMDSIFFDGVDEWEEGDYHEHYGDMPREELLDVVVAEMLHIQKDVTAESKEQFFGLDEGTRWWSGFYQLRRAYLIKSVVDHIMDPWREEEEEEEDE